MYASVRSMAQATTSSDVLKEYARGFAGGMIFSLPLLYTMEVWWSGFFASPMRLLGYLVAVSLLLLGYNRFAGMHHDSTWREVLLDSVEELGLGLVTAFVLLWTIGQIREMTELHEMLGKTVVEGGVIAIGFSVGSAQLGGGSTEASDDDLGHGTSSLAAQIAIAFCGSMLFAANVAPTEEILVIAYESTPLRLLCMVIFSLVVAGLILVYSDFKSSSRYVGQTSFVEAAGEISTAFVIALIASSLMLWFFGRFDDVPPAVALQLIIVLAFPAVLGASAGRLLLQE